MTASSLPSSSLTVVPAPQYPFGFAIKIDTTVIAGSLLAISAVCFSRPDLTPSLLFFLIAITLLIVDIPSSFIQPITNTLAVSMTHSIQESMDVASKSKDTIKSHSSIPNKTEPSTPILVLGETIADAIIQALVTNQPSLDQQEHGGGTVFYPSVKPYVIAVMNDDDLKKAVMETISSALMTALIEDRQGDGQQSLMQTIPLVVQKAIVGTLSNEDFVTESTKSIVDAIVSASQNQELTDNMMDVITQSVSRALQDERFVSEIRHAMKDTLKDGSIYRAGAKGMLSAAFGGGNTVTKETSGGGSSGFSDGSSSSLK